MVISVLQVLRGLLEILWLQGIPGLLSMLIGTVGLLYTRDYFRNTRKTRPYNVW